MARRHEVSEVTKISDDAVAAKTGRVWRDWFAELDRAGADGWDHKTIARHLRSGYGLEPWWSQTVTVAYERARGLRDKHEKADGYEIQVERTVDGSYRRMCGARCPTPNGDSSGCPNPQGEAAERAEDKPLPAPRLARRLARADGLQRQELRQVLGGGAAE